MNKLYCYYRISDKGNPFGRTDLSNTFLSTVTRRKLFNNFLDAFGTENLKVFADNADPETIEFIKLKGIENINVTSLGQMAGFMYVINSAIFSLKSDDIIYMIEDDYLHTHDARRYIFEGIEIGDYVTLYDSLDKYIDSAKGGNNPLIDGGGEDTKVILGSTSHFKLTNSTTGTFAVRVGTLQEDLPVINKYFTPEKVYDFLLFRELVTVKNRKIVCPIPGKASHVGLELAPFVDWETIVSNLREE
jgi:hypothetical protein